jgi:hypothetical protein
MLIRNGQWIIVGTGAGLRGGAFLDAHPPPSGGSETLPNVSLIAAAPSFPADVPDGTLLAMATVAVPPGADRRLTLGGDFAIIDPNDATRRRILRRGGGVLPSVILILGISDVSKTASNSPQDAVLALSITSAPATENPNAYQWPDGSQAEWGDGSAVEF